jgi:phosphoribosylamine--glycine ligase
VFENPDEALEYINKQGQYPTVIKADGLALGKGVIIANDFSEAKNAVISIMENKIFGDSGSRVVVEDFLTGPEVSVLAFTDSKTVIPMVSSMDHKRAFNGDLGPNTGGMGTISPNPFYSENTARFCLTNIFIPTVKAMNSEGRPFKGCLYFGLMLTENGPKVIEYNARFGDPETQVILPRLKTPLADIIEATIEEKLSDISIEWYDNACACVIMASGGYPGSYSKGYQIFGLDENGQAPDVTVYHSGTIAKNGSYFTNGGRVIGVTASGNNIQKAIESAYIGVSGINFENVQYRTDIGAK